MIIQMPQRHRESFEKAAWPHRPALYRLALRLVRRPDAADDLVQDTFLRAFHSFHTFEPGTNARAWLCQILRRAFVSRYRRERVRRAEVTLESVADGGLQRAAPFDPRGSDPEAIAMSSVLPDELRRAMMALPRSFREAVQHAWLDEMSYQEIAQRLSVPAGTVMSRIHRGRRMLQKSLREFAASRRLVGADGGAGRLVA